MKPLHIVLLVVAGAIGGAVATNVVHKSHGTAPVPSVAQVQQPASAVDTQAQSAPPASAPAPEAVAPEPAKPSPMQTSKAATHARTAREAANPEPVAVAQDEPQVAALPPTPSPEPVPQASAATPARPEPEQVTPVAPLPPPPPNQVTLNAGTLIPVRLIDGLSTERSRSGDTFTATLDKALAVDGFVIAERGARVEGRVVASDPGGKAQGVAALAVELTRLHTSDGQAVPLQTDSFERHAERTQRQDAEKVGGGAVLGAVIGAIAGGGKGAAIGAGVGGGAGAGDVLLTRGKPATLPSETRVSFRLRAPVTIAERR